MATFSFLLRNYVVQIFVLNSGFLLCFRVVFNTLFGLSMNFWMAISTRFLLGSLNGLLGPIKVSFLGNYLIARIKLNITMHCFKKHTSCRLEACLKAKLSQKALKIYF